MIKFENTQNGRYYYLLIQQDLFGDNVLIVIRGGQHNQRFYIAFSGNHMEIQQEIKKITQRRIKRGYTLVN